MSLWTIKLNFSLRRFKNADIHQSSRAFRQHHIPVWLVIQKNKNIFIYPFVFQKNFLYTHVLFASSLLYMHFYLFLFQRKSLGVFYISEKIILSDLRCDWFICMMMHACQHCQRHTAIISEEIIGFCSEKKWNKIFKKKEEATE